MIEWWFFEGKFRITVGWNWRSWTFGFAVDGFGHPGWDSLSICLLCLGIEFGFFDEPPPVYWEQPE